MANSNTFDEAKTVRQIYKLFADYEELKQEVASLREIVETLNIKVESNNDVYNDTNRGYVTITDIAPVKTSN